MVTLRARGETSNFGAFLDPVADKLMVSAALAVLLQLDRCNAIFAFVIIGREITISALREWMAKIGAGKSVAVSFVGKLKTTAQMVAIPMLLYNDDLLGMPIHIMGTVLIVIAAVLTVWSMIYYLRKAAPDLRRES
jgi:cardiolipin synthase